MMRVREFGSTQRRIFLLLLAIIGGADRTFAGDGSMPLPAGHAMPIVAPVASADEHAPERTAAVWTTAIAVDAAGHVWAGFDDDRLGVYDPSNQKWAFVPTPSSACTDPITALAVDKRGRVWAGHSYNGVSVFNGTEWKTFGLVDGPLGEHVNAITINPTNGDVWLATNRGLTRYSDADDRWTYVTRGQGLASDDVVGVAIDNEGTCYAATSDQGISIGHAGDKYAAWTNVQAKESVLDKASGPGLVSNWCNDVRVMSGGTVFVATIDGLSYSRDRGTTWAFVRGQNWTKKAELAAVPPTLPPNPPAGLLSENACVCLGENARGQLLVGHMRKPVDVVDPATMTLDKSLSENTTCPTQFARAPDGTTYIAAYGKSVLTDDDRIVGPTEPSGGPETQAAPKLTIASPAPQLPSPAKPPEAAELQKMLSQVTALPMPKLLAATIGTDWVTGGDCMGRYGWDAYMFPSYGVVPDSPDFKVSVGLGPHQWNSNRFYYYATVKSSDPRHPYMLATHSRGVGEYNDGTYRKDFVADDAQGPDLWVTLKVPDGRWRVTLFEMNSDPHVEENRTRDYLIKLKAFDDDLLKAEAAPALATMRAHRHTEGYYGQFAVSGGQWLVQIDRNASSCTKVNAVFIDRLGPSTQPADNADARPSDAVIPTANTPDEKAALALWERLGNDPSRSTSVLMAYRLLAYRRIVTMNGHDDFKTACRWSLPVWTPQDRKDFSDTMATIAKSAKPADGHDAPAP